MSINLEQKITLLIFTGLFFVLYFGCDTTSKEIQDLEKSRNVNVQYLDINREIRAKIDELPTADQVILEQWQVNLDESLEEEQKIEILKKISGKWYDSGQPLIASHYAAKIAELEKSDSAWAIAGSTAYIAMVSAKDENPKKYAQQQAVEGFEKAISIAPERVDYKINHALTFVEMPPKENPMKGITMLLDLEKNNPDSSAVHLQLGRLALQTNQIEKAIVRFEKVINLEPNGREAHCYLVEIYRKQQDKAKVDYHSKFCLEDN